MTRTDAKNFVNFISEKIPMYYADVSDGSAISHECVWKVADVRAAVEHLPTYSETKVDCNYEAEYHRVLELASNMETRAKKAEEHVAYVEAELSRLRTIIKTFEFIFDRKFED